MMAVMEQDITWFLPKTQHHISQFMMNEIEAVDEDGEELGEETQTQLFIVSSSMIGLLNAAVVRS